MTFRFDDWSPPARMVKEMLEGCVLSGAGYAKARAMYTHQKGSLYGEAG